MKSQADFQGSGYTGRYHAMKTRNNAYHLGDTGFYGFAFYLQSAWDFSGSQQYQLFQFIADYSNTGCDDWQPSTMVWVAGNQLATRRNYGSSACNRTVQSYTGLATVSGSWRSCCAGVDSRGRTTRGGFSISHRSRRPIPSWPRSTARFKFHSANCAAIGTANDSTQSPIRPASRRNVRCWRISSTNT